MTRANSPGTTPAWLKDLKKTGEIENVNLRIFLYGKPGTGKTEFAGTAPNPLFICAEDGMLTLFKKKGIDYILLDDTQDNNIYTTVTDILKHARNKTGPFVEDGPLAHIETIVFDSLSALNEMLLRQMLTKARKDKPEFDEWGRLKNQISTIAFHHKTLPMHAIAITGEGARENPLEGELVPCPNIQGSFRDDVMHLYDFNFWMHKKARGANVQYLCATNDTRGRNAKSRIKLPHIIENVTFDKLTEALK